MLLPDERRALAEAGRWVASRGLVVGTAGNLSTRADEHIVVTPMGGVLGELTPEMMSVVDPKGTRLDGDLAPTSELPLHLLIYGTTDAQGVAHVHAPASTAVACTHDELPAVHYTILELGGAIRVAPYATFGSDELAANVTSALRGRVAALMENHGSVAYGKDIAQACSRIDLLEWHAELYVRCLAVGTPRVLSGGQLEAVVMAALDKGYGVRDAAAGRPRRTGGA
jgi:L-fuculose-phosphate aldolase